MYAVGDITAQKVAEMPLEAWRRILDANLTGAYVATRAFSPLFSPEPHLFYIGAISEKLILPGLSACRSVCRPKPSSPKMSPYAF